MDHRIGSKFLKVSAGFGGSCFQKDILNLVYLCKYFGLDEVAEYWYQVIKINDFQKNRFAKKIINHFGGDLTDKKIAILGWAFKANTNDSRESAAIYVAEKLYNAGANINIYDPCVSDNSVRDDIFNYWKIKVPNIKSNLKIHYSDSIKNAITQVDAIAIMTDWDEFKNYDYHNQIIFDGRNIINRDNKNIFRL